MTQQGFQSVTAEQRESSTTNYGKSSGLPFIDSSVSLFSPVDGVNIIRLLPAVNGESLGDIFGAQVWTYFINSKGYLSPSTFDSNLRDPISQHFFKIRETDTKAAEPFRGTKKHLVWVLDFNGLAQGEAPPVKLWVAPISVMESILSYSRDRATGALIPIEDAKNGRIIYFSKSGAGINTKYEGYQLGDPYPLQDDVGNHIKLYKDVLQVPTTEQMQEVLDQMLASPGEAPQGGYGGGVAPRPNENNPVIEDGIPPHVSNAPPPQPMQPAPMQPAPPPPPMQPAPDTAAGGYHPPAEGFSPPPVDPSAGAPAGTAPGIADRVRQQMEGAGDTVQGSAPGTPTPTTPQ